MSFLSCEEMLAAARSQNISLSEAILRSDLAESRLTEAHSREMMHHLWQVMQATSRDYDPAQRSRSGLSGGDAAKVEQAHQEGKSFGGDYLAAVTAEALKTAECNAHRRCPPGGQLRRPARCSAAAGPQRRGRRRVHLRRPLCRRRVRSGHRGPRHSRGRGGRLSGRGGRGQRDGRRRSLPPQGRRAGAVCRCRRNGSGQPTGPRLRPCGRPRGSSLRQTECRRRRERRLLCEYGPCRGGLRHPL